jgi:hypothetical protein
MKSHWQLSFLGSKNLLSGRQVMGDIPNLSKTLSMRNSVCYAYLVTPVFLFALVSMTSGCETTHVAYHSTADVPYYTSSTSTQMELVTGDVNPESQIGYLVFTATDNSQNSYVLLAPSESTDPDYTFGSANFGRAVPLQKAEVEELTEGLRRTLKLWGESNSSTEGSFYEFLHAPEQEIRRVSQNVIQWQAAVKFTASHTPEGPSARLLLGDSPNESLQYVIEFDNRSDVSDFRDLLKSASNQLGTTVDTD